MAHESDPNMKRTGRRQDDRRGSVGLALYLMRQIVDSLATYHLGIARECRRISRNLPSPARDGLDRIARREEETAQAIREAAEDLPKHVVGTYVRFVQPVKLPAFDPGDAKETDLDSFLAHVSSTDEQVIALCRAMVRASGSEEHSRFFTRLRELEQATILSRSLARTLDRDL